LEANLLRQDAPRPGLLKRLTTFPPHSATPHPPPPPRRTSAFNYTRQVAEQCNDDLLQVMGLSPEADYTRSPAFFLLLVYGFSCSLTMADQTALPLRFEEEQSSFLLALLSATPA